MTNSYKIKYTETFKEFLKKYKKDKALMQELYDTIKKLKEEPKGKPLTKPLKGFYSIRIKRKFRLVIKVSEEHKVIYLVAFGKRKSIYKEILKIKQ